MHASASSVSFIKKPKPKQPVTRVWWKPINQSIKSSRLPVCHSRNGFFRKSWRGRGRRLWGEKVHRLLNRGGFDFFVSINAADNTSASGALFLLLVLFLVLVLLLFLSSFCGFGLQGGGAWLELEIGFFAFLGGVLVRILEGDFFSGYW